MLFVDQLLILNEYYFTLWCIMGSNIAGALIQLEIYYIYYNIIITVFQTTSQPVNQAICILLFCQLYFLFLFK